MPIYNASKSDSDGRGLARELARMDRRIAAGRRGRAGDVPDPTPQPAAVGPGSLTQLGIRELTP
jgi:hypothetical protein